MNPRNEFKLENEALQPIQDLFTSWKTTTDDLKHSTNLDWLATYIFQDVIMCLVDINCDDFKGFNKFSHESSLFWLRTRRNFEVMIEPNYEGLTKDDRLNLIKQKQTLPFPFYLPQKFISSFVNAMNNKFPELNMIASKLEMEEKEEQKDNNDPNLFCVTYFNLDVKIFLSEVMPKIYDYLSQHPEFLKKYERFNFKYHADSQDELQSTLLNDYGYTPCEVLPQSLYENQQRATWAREYFLNQTYIIANVVDLIDQYLGVTKFGETECIKLKFKEQHKYSVACQANGSFTAANQLMLYLNKVAPRSTFFKTISADVHAFTISNQVMNHPSISSDLIAIEDYITAQKTSGTITWSLKESVSQLKLLADEIANFKGIHKYQATKIILENILKVIQAMHQFKSIAVFNNINALCYNTISSNFLELAKKSFPTMYCCGLFKPEEENLKFIDKLALKLRDVLLNIGNLVNKSFEKDGFTNLTPGVIRDDLSEIIEHTWPEAKYKMDLIRP